MKIKVNLKKFLSLKGASLVLALSLCTTTLTGCAKKAECNIKTPHAHLYRNEQGYTRYIAKENLNYEGYEYTVDHIPIEGEEKLYEFIDKKDLINIHDNLDVILAIQEKNKNFKEYRYSYTYMQENRRVIIVGKIPVTRYSYTPTTRYSWTKNLAQPEKTGEERDCHYVYIAYKIEKDENGKYVLIPSEYIDDIRQVMDEYPYIKKQFYKVVDSSGKEITYEDGRYEDLSEVEKQRIKEYEKNHNTSVQAENIKTLTKKLDA